MIMRVWLTVERSCPTKPAECQVVPSVRACCSTRTTSVQPSRASWYATLQPTTPPPMAGLLAGVPAWVGRAVTAERLPGGLSHHIFRVDVDGESFVLRVLDPAVSEAGLGIPPDQEIANTVRAAQGGAGPRVHEVL